MSETAGPMTYQTIECKKADSVGFVIPNVQIKIVDTENRKILGFKEKGELCVKTPTAMIYYYRNSAATKSAFDDEGLKN